MKKEPIKKTKQRIDKFISQLEYMSSVQNYDKSVIYMESDNDGTAASVCIDEKYQRIDLRIYPCFFTNSLQNQREYLVHEFVHVLLLPLQDAVYDLQEGKLVTKRESDKALEKSTSAVTEILVRLLMKNKLEYLKKAFADYIK